MNCCDYKCDQGRNCPARKAPTHTELPITMEDDFMNFDWCIRMLWDAMRWVGVILLVLLVAFFFGYKS